MNVSTVPFAMVVVVATCCRRWPVALGCRLGRCGYCHQVPVINLPLEVVP